MQTVILAVVRADISRLLFVCDVWYW